MEIKLIDLVREMQDIGRQKSDLEDRLKAVNKAWDEIRKVTIPEAMAAIDPNLNKISISGIGTVYVRGDLYSGIADKEQAFEWLRANGYEDLIQAQINPSTLKAWMKEQIREGVEIPECFRCNPYSYAVILK